MSRSRRAPWTVDGYGTNRKRYAKNQANRAVRRSEDVPNGKAYRKFYNPWDISDYRWMEKQGSKWYEKAKRK
jgi:hypothetical protein